MENIQKLTSYIEALYPIIYINNFDFNSVDKLIKQVADNIQTTNIVEFNNGLGVVDFKDKHIIHECDLHDFLTTVKDEGYEEQVIIVLKDVHGSLEKTEIIALLKYISERNMNIENYNATIIIVSNVLTIPKELEELITVYDIPYPTQNKIYEIIKSFAESLKIDVADEVVNELSLSLKGLNEFQIGQILNLAYQDGACLDYDDKKLIISQKEQLIKKTGLLEMIRVNESLDDIGGLENLKLWLKRKAIIFKQLDKALKFGVDMPKGILIVGMPGCGKSLTAKATSNLFNVPLVRLDVGRLLGKYVGESEENMRNALKMAEAISPCVLWIDEIEKAFSGIGGSGGGNEVTTRLFGQFLTWMQEKENTVFIVATANNISNIPPEFLRKGRFDELFFVDLPKEDERYNILNIHLKKRNQSKFGLDIHKLAKDTDGYSGSDLEAIVKEAVENCYISERKSLTNKDLEDAKKNIKSISEVLKTQINQIREAVKNMDLTPAHKDQSEDEHKKEDKVGYNYKSARESFEVFRKI